MTISMHQASVPLFKRQLGALQLTLLGIGAIIGTGIFVLTAVAANKAGPGMMWAFVIAAGVCALTALIYAEIAAMVPVAGSAYTYSYAVLGEFIAWLVGWALVSASGRSPVIFGSLRLPRIAPFDESLYFILRQGHSVLAYLIVAMVAAHVSAVLLHTLTLRDGMLSRMVR